MKITVNDKSSTAEVTKGAMLSIWKSCRVEMALCFEVSQCLLPGCHGTDFVGSLQLSHLKQQGPNIWPWMDV